ncbi:MAG TPA: hypothetical protein VNQ73_24075 [Ilumatobacter sp.]|nr:hypothetical protein [Ilumatobacter sp.]
MAVTETQRHELYESIKVHLGESEAHTFIQLMPPDWTQLATKADLDVLEARLESRLLRAFGTWLFTSQAVVIAAVGLIVGLFG